MKKLLKEKVGDEYEVEVDTHGVSGELVLEMGQRIQILCTCFLPFPLP
jgi:hypothetical protein